MCNNATIKESDYDKCGVIVVLNVFFYGCYSLILFKGIHAKGNTYMQNFVVLNFRIKLYDVLVVMFYYRATLAV